MAKRSLESPISLNTTIQKTTGFSPIRLLIGREGNIPSTQARLTDVFDETTQPIINMQNDRVLAQQWIQVEI